MKQTYLTIIVLIVLCAGSLFTSLQGEEDKGALMNSTNKKIQLPQPKYNSETSIERALLIRRSIRHYKDEALSINEISQILWAAQGITEPAKGFRTVPSAGALYPLDVYIIINNVKNITKGVYKYVPHKHEIVKVKDKDVTEELTSAALGQRSVREAAALIIFSAIYEKTTKKYGNRGIRYIYMEAGHAAQNVYLQAVSLNLGTVVIGAFKDDMVKKILNMLDKEEPLYIMPLGKI